VLEIWRAYIRTYDRLGNDPFVGRRLVSLLHQAGRCSPEHLIFFGGCSGQPVFADLVENLAGSWSGRARRSCRRDVSTTAVRRTPSPPCAGGAPVPTPLCGSPSAGEGVRPA